MLEWPTPDRSTASRFVISMAVISRQFEEQRRVRTRASREVGGAALLGALLFPFLP